LEHLRNSGQAYPNDFRRDSLNAHLHEHYATRDNDFFHAQPCQVKIAGRIMMRRLMGKAIFLHLQDMTGLMQVYHRQEELPDGEFDEIKKWDLGDIVGVIGNLFKTKTDELTVRAEQLMLLTKALRPLPDKYHGLTDQEACYRQRYLDLIANEQTRNLFKMRTSLIQGIRKFLNERHFLEVETPMMQVLAGGAAARPFVTHHNALDMELYLRIAPELYLKRLVVGGFEKVYEINRNFRNEGLSTRHNPEFTMLEFYQAYADYKDLMALTEELFRFLALSIVESTTIQYQGHTIDFGKPFTYMTVKEAILHYNPQFTEAELDDRHLAKKIADKLGIAVREDDGIGKIQVEIFEQTVEDKLIQPTFITAYPTEVSPLARKSDHDAQVTDRFELFITGREIANGFSELNDPDDQAERFKAQVANKEAGDLEAMSYDEDYITALEYGLPPTAGEGIGIDRLVMLFTDSASIRDVILFPHMRPRESL
ncbi:MAG: lysine--tRNA ligase, partial [Gammaproteobacteria bacterium]